MNNPQTIKDLPSPKGKSLTGNLTEFKANNKHRVLEKWVTENGDIFKISLAGKKFIVSANFELNGEILKNRPQTFRRYNKIEEILKEIGVLGVFNAEGDEWMKHRKITAEALNMKNVKRFYPIIQNITERLQHKWNTLSKSDSTLDIQKEMMKYTVDITTLIAFGHDSNTLENDNDVIQQSLMKIFPMVNQRITAPLPIWRFIKGKKDKELDLALKTLEEHIHHYIQLAKKELKLYPFKKEAPTNFLEALLVEQEKENKFTDLEIFGNVFTMLLAGEDTTSNTISWIIFYLLINPKYIDLIRNEADFVLGNNIVLQDVAKLNELKFTEAVILETLRINPVTPNLIMEALETVEINGLIIEKGMSVMMQNKVAQTSEDNFSEPNTFDPNRWLVNKCPYNNHSPDKIRAFGGGSRFCPGKTLAIDEMKTVISMIFKNFDLELAVPANEVQEIYAFTMFPANLIVNISPRIK